MSLTKRVVASEQAKPKDAQIEELLYDRAQIDYPDGGWIPEKTKFFPALFVR